MLLNHFKGVFQKIFSSRKKPLTFEEYVKNRRAQGYLNKQIQKELLTDLNNGKGIFKDFVEDLQPTFPNSKRRFGDQKTNNNGEWLYKWSALNLPKYPSCPDCLERHGQSKTMREWEKLGLPRSGKTRCKKECKCGIVPDCDPLPETAEA